MTFFKSLYEETLIENLEWDSQQYLAESVLEGDTEAVTIDKLIKANKIEKSQVEEFYKKLVPFLNKVKDKFDRQIKTAIRKQPNAKFLSGIKPISSVVDKTVNRKKSMSRMGDLVRGAVLFSTKEEADEFAHNFVRKNKSNIVEFETKERGGDKVYGYYGSHHLTLLVDGLPVEIQVMSKKLWSYKSSAHDIYTQNRSKGGELSKADRHLSNQIFSMGNQNRRFKESLDEEFLTERAAPNALAYAKEKHGSQKWGKHPYHVHLTKVRDHGFEVFGSKFNRTAQQVALLHDVLEDTSVTEEEMLNDGFSQDVVDAVKILTRSGTGTYESDIDGIIATGNRTAMMVKLADNLTNYRLRPEGENKASLKARYLKSIQKLTAKLGIQMPDISEETFYK